MASLFQNTPNFSLYTVPVAWVLCLAPHIYAAKLYEKATSRQFDTREPRSLIKTVAENQSVDSTTRGRIIRADSAQLNGFENLGLFAAAVVAGNMARLDNGWLNMMSAGYVLSRLVYNLIYINNTTAALARTRSLVYISGITMIWTLFIMAGNKLWSSV